MRNKHIGTVICLAVFALFAFVYTDTGEARTRARDRSEMTIFPENIVEVAPAVYVEELGDVIVRFRTVLFGKYSLAGYIEALNRTEGLNGVESVLDIGTGSGSLSFVSLALGAQKAVGTDLDPLAVKNALYNAKRLGYEDRFEARLVSASEPGPYSVVGSDERFDLIISNPPQGFDVELHPFSENDTGAERRKQAAYAADPGFVFLEALIGGFKGHLTENGRAILVFTNPAAAREAERFIVRERLKARLLFFGKDDLPAETALPFQARSLRVYEVRKN